MKRLKRILKFIGIFLVLVLVIGGASAFIISRLSVLPDNINMSSARPASADMTGMNMPGMEVGTPGANVTPITNLVASDTNAPVKAFSLTTQKATVDLGNGETVDAYTYNGTLPGPEL